MALRNGFLSETLWVILKIFIKLRAITLAPYSNVIEHKFSLYQQLLISNIRTNY